MKGMDMMLKAMGVDPNALKQMVEQQIADMTQLVGQGAADIQAMRASMAHMDAKLDAIMAALGVDAPPSPVMAVLPGAIVPAGVVTVENE